MDSKVIFVVDDEESICKYLKILLEKNGYTVFTADSPVSCADLLAKTVPDLIILDVNMPGMSGYDFAKLIKKQMRPIPILFLTARKSDQDLITSFDVGGSEYMTKPFDDKKLLNTIKRLIAEPSATKRVQKY